MVTKLEKQFFKTFEIEQIEYTQCTTIGCKHIYGDCNNCPFHNIYKIDYPQITDHILLKLICIANSQNIGFEGDNIEDIKKDLLDNFIFFKRDVYDQIHNLFKGVE